MTLVAMHAVSERIAARGPGLLVALALLWCAGGAPAAAQDAAALDVLQVRPDLYLIAGAGANIAVQIGEDGVVVVDSGRTEHADRVLAEIRKLTRRPIRTLINTSANRNHVGGNAALSEAGEPIIPLGGLNDIGAFGGRAPIVAEEKVVARLSEPRGQDAPLPTAAWPTITYASALREFRKDIYLNGQAIQVLHQPAAHSDGDSLVFFRRSDVIATGAIVDTTQFPAIDLEAGGSIQGLIDSLNRIIELAVPSIPLTWQDGGTVIIPGYGRLMEEADVVDYRDMITIIRDRVRDGIDKGLTLPQIQQRNPTQGYRARYGRDSGPWTTERFVEAVYRSEVGRAAGAPRAGR